MSEINVLYSFDTHFSKLAAVSIYSLLKSQNKTTHVNLYIMCPPRTRGKSRINKIAAQFGANITWRPIRNSPYKNYSYDKWSPVIFYRLFAWREFPDVEKMLYLDCDTLVFQDLTKLFNTDLADNIIGAAPDSSPIDSPHGGEIGRYVKSFIDTHMNGAPYINSGVILMNMKKMAETHHDFLSAPITLRYPDQDLLNYVLCGKIKYLDNRYNYSYYKWDSATEQDNPENYPIIHCYVVKPYLDNTAPKKLFIAFNQLASEINLTQDEMVKEYITKVKRVFARKTHVPFIRITPDNRVKLFGIKIT